MSRTQTETIRVLRAFNRFQTRHFGVLANSYMGSGLSLAEGRILFEIGRNGATLASSIQETLGLDAGYLSRTLARMERSGLISRSRGEDGRQRPIALTPSGLQKLDHMDATVRHHVLDSIAHLDEGDQIVLQEAARTMVRLLSKGAVGL